MELRWNRAISKAELWYLTKSPVSRQTNDYCLAIKALNFQAK